MASRLAGALLFATLITPSAAMAQGGTQSGTQSAPAAARTPLTLADIRALAEAHLAIGAVHDSADALSAQTKNKTKEAQHELSVKKREQFVAVLKTKGLDEDEYLRRRFLISTNAEYRAQFDSVVARMTGAPLPGRIAPPVVRGFVAASALPAGMVGTHIGHVTTSFVDTPDKSGFLPMAFAEAQIAAQHATLATRTPTDLAAMQLHAGHVLHALDPNIEKTGPGKGFGFVRAAGGVAQHVELAAKESTASPNVKTHAQHVATASRSAMKRAEQAVALAKQIREAKDAAAAATLTAQLASVCAQLAAGVDSNADGRIGWDKDEGGLQQADEHLKLLLAGEKK
ncbi:MAG: hypothetical protein IBJ03_08700 [Gemmatimonadaceae bacterium]|nr:hypothetical protein [Gemmatimonadaceae bacterium]